MLRRLAAVLTLAAALTACGPTADASGGAAFDGNGFRVRVPDGWQAQATDPHAWRGGQTIALFSTQALDPQCEGPGASNCRTPLETLDEGSALVWWVTTTCA